MKFLQITEIPKSLIATRWLKTNFLYVDSIALLNSEMFHLPTKERHFTKLIQDCNELAVVASASEMRYSKAKEDIKKLLAALKLLEIDANLPPEISENNSKEEEIYATEEDDDEIYATEEVDDEIYATEDEDDEDEQNKEDEGDHNERDDVNDNLDDFEGNGWSDMVEDEYDGAWSQI
ncbi:histone chaperone RTT106-like [Humulus lupulus]|uniref:histone chaperone RTT106-like n=1 Tax=Humulus lupulus TaxID=3486 RepID=UPI002B41456C|nr:histone chaperone RTT106-like [Humulus lupulus]